MSRQELIELVLRLQRPEKTSRTSSKPPSTDRKARRDKSRPGGATPGHEGHIRSLSENFDRAVDHRADECPGCRASLSADLPADLVSEHETIELPPIRPFVERHRRLAVRCPSCGMRVAAEVPDAAMGTPFGPRIHATATYLKTLQALSYERLQGAFSNLFGLTISQGSLMNMLRRAQKQFAGGRDDAVSKLRQARIISSDETGVRIEGSNSYHWVFRSDCAVVHTAAPTRGAIVVRTMMDGHRPEVWCSDRYAAQQGHADAQQACLAHLARDVAYAIDNGDDFLPMRFRLWLQKAFGLAKDIRHLAPSTIAARRRALDRTLCDILGASTSCDFARVIQKKFARASNQLLTFVDWPGLVEPTNNACERSLRPASSREKSRTDTVPCGQPRVKPTSAPWSTRPV
jgi:transposase